MGVACALCHVSPFHATKSWIPWLISKSTSHVRVGNGHPPAVCCPWAGDVMAMSSRCCWDHSLAMLGSSAAHGSEPGWPCLPGSTALPQDAFKMFLACQAAVPEPQLTLTRCTSPCRAPGPGARQSRAASNAAPSSVHLVVWAPITQEHFRLVFCTFVLHLTIQSKMKLSSL